MVLWHPFIPLIPTDLAIFFAVGHVWIQVICQWQTIWNKLETINKPILASRQHYVNPDTILHGLLPHHEACKPSSSHSTSPLLTFLATYRPYECLCASTLALTTSNKVNSNSISLQHCLGSITGSCYHNSLPNNPSTHRSRPWIVPE
jgi:hypothetical protein